METTRWYMQIVTITVDGSIQVVIVYVKAVVSGCVALTMNRAITITTDPSGTQARNDNAPLGGQRTPSAPPPGGLRKE
tara:strand:+ start:1768 stop:2001 length:234 start_codon:yes stop_codon:yes gene_type:complete